MTEWGKGPFLTAGMTVIGWIPATDCGYDEEMGNSIVITTDSLISFGVRLMVTPGTKISIHSRND
jgi:hypothetical protein